MWSIINWIIGWIFGIKSSPIAVSVVRTVGKIMSGLPEGSVTRCFTLVQSASMRDDLDGREKFELVYKGMTEAYPGIGESTLNTVIECVESMFAKRVV